MARNNNVVHLGYEEELITDKHIAQIDFTTNKLGGKPDYPYCTAKFDQHIICPLCKIPCRLIVQIYAPLENSTFHRTLYVFACINTICWNRQESWTCLRVQVKNFQTNTTQLQENVPKKLNSKDWCSEADDWGDNDNNANLDEQNCNSIANNTGECKTSEDEESSSYDDSLQSVFCNVSIEENANNGAQGAVARLYAPMATAEIEADENGEVVSVETPTSPKTNLAALLQGDNSQVVNVPNQAGFIPHFISVFPEEETISAGTNMDNHVKDLLNDYQKKDANLSLNSHVNGEATQDVSVKDMEVTGEEYEKSKPLHGDKMFHHFLTRIKSNPEQILRYNREGAPLLLYPLHDQIGVCKYCKKELIFEFQLIPTLISKLRLSCDPPHCNRLDFGTVLIYTCRDCCWEPNDSFKEETVIVQREIF
ncbi:programmed cell death protein 2-like [Euwallacea fornicatus]|uniref:programmed cell death protein 2-like n=1 Tax=Euwallacea fornicatus TaxID=995702 RepID=UPI00338F8ADD